MNQSLVMNEVLRWWHSMQLSPQELRRRQIPIAPSAYKAILKRCSTLEEVIISEGFRNLWFALPEEQQTTTHLSRWAVIAAVLVYVTENSNDSLPQAAGAPRDGDATGTPIVSELRFARLLSIETPEALLRTLRRLIQQLKGRVSVEKLCADITSWFAEQQRKSAPPAAQSIQMQWCMQYYQAQRPHK